MKIGDLLDEQPNDGETLDETVSRLLDSSKFEKDNEEELFFWNDTFQECVDRIRLLRPNTRQEVLFTFFAILHF